MKTIQFLLLQPLKQGRILMLLAIFCLSLLTVRAVLTQSLFFFFLAWNLFLAYTPLALSTFLINRVNLIEKKVYFFPLFLIWLLLLPNAPYIITDFVHLQRELDVPVWFDVLLLISFSVTGLLYGLASMKHMYQIIASTRGTVSAKMVIAGVSILSAYGIYLGRYLRYNSWDILHKPVTIATDIVLSITDPSCYKASIGITLGFGTLLYLLFSLYNDSEQ